MKILAVETSTKHLSIAVAEDDTVLVSRSVPPKRDLSLSITFDIERVLQKAGIFLHEIDAYVVGLGPGSFTSLRVGLSMLKAFIMVNDRLVVGVPSLDVIAMNVKSRRTVQVCVISDARRNLMYSCVYEKTGSALKRQTEHLLKPVAEVLPLLSGEVVFVGDGIPLCLQTIREEAARHGKFTPVFEDEKHWLPNARELAYLGWQRLARKDVDRIETITPLYLYPEDCQVTHQPSGAAVPPEKLQ
jgi:tRNA threonylcarbamoyladenosine biosynthesis protein TsaB